MNKKRREKRQKRSIWQLIRKLFGLLSLIPLYGGNLVVHASSYDFSWLTDGSHDNNAFNDLTETVQNTGGSLYKLMMAIGAIGLLVSLIICGIMIAVGTNANKRSEHISHLIYIVVGGIIIFGAMAIIGLLQSIGGNI